MYINVLSELQIVLDFILLLYIYISFISQLYSFALYLPLYFVLKEVRKE